MKLLKLITVVFLIGITGLVFHKNPVTAEDKLPSNTIQLEQETNSIHSESPTWSETSPNPSPSPRRGSILAYDNALSGVVLFGGANESVHFDETWIYHNNNWQLLSPANPPRPRVSSSMVFDPIRQQLVLFGGANNDDPIFELDDTWEFNGAEWVKKFPLTSPIKRSGHGMVFRTANNRIVLFGGWGPGGPPLNDTWQYDGTNWTQITTQHLPPPRFNFAIAYDSSRDRIIVYGGCENWGCTIILNDTWEFDGLDWYQVYPPTSPGPRAVAKMVYDPIRQKTVLFGGCSAISDFHYCVGTTYNDTWEYDGTTWTQITTTTSPGPRYEHAMSFDGSTQKILLFGGRSVPPELLWGDTWEYSATGSSISGYITDGSGNPIAGIDVSAGPGYSAITDDAGFYTIANVTSGTYTVTPLAAGYSFSPSSRQVSVPPDATGVDFVGSLPDIGFRPNPDGYSFENWDFYDENIDYNDYTIEDMQRVFGDNAVCQTVDPVCQPKPPAESWNQMLNVLMSRGHCYGMSVSSLRFFKNIDTHPDTNTVFGLNKKSNVSIHWDVQSFTTTTRRNISFFQATQYFDPVKETIHQAKLLTPKEVLSRLADALSGGAPDPMSLVMFYGDSGHAVTPYDITNPSQGLYWVWVYDNNHPGDANRYININTFTNIWTYYTGWAIWSGDSTSKTLGVIPTTIHNQPMRCPWCTNSSVSNSTNATIIHTLLMNGEGHLLISDSQGRRLGFVGNEYFEEIPGGYGVTQILGTDVGSEPIYTFPITETYSIIVDGQTLTRTVSSTLAQSGPGFVVSVEDISVSPTTNDSVYIANDGKQIAYNASQSQEPTLTISLDGMDKSYGLKLQELDISGGEMITLTANTAEGYLTMDGSRSSGGIYGLLLNLVTTSGSYNFNHSNIPILATDTHIINFGNWNGSGSMVLDIDHGSDGSIDESVVLFNDSDRVFIPMLLRN